MQLTAAAGGGPQQQAGSGGDTLQAAGGGGGGGVQNLGVVGRGTKRINLQPVQVRVVPFCLHVPLCQGHRLLVGVSLVPAHHAGPHTPTAVFLCPPLRCRPTCLRPWGAAPPPVLPWGPSLLPRRSAAWRILWVGPWWWGEVLAQPVPVQMGSLSPAAPWPHMLLVLSGMFTAARKYLCWYHNITALVRLAAGGGGETTIGFGSAPAPAPAAAPAAAQPAAPSPVPAFLQAASVQAVYGGAAAEQE